MTLDEIVDELRRVNDAITNQNFSTKDFNALQARRAELEAEQYRAISRGRATPQHAGYVSVRDARRIAELKSQLEHVKFQCDRERLEKLLQQLESGR